MAHRLKGKKFLARLVKPARILRWVAATSWIVAGLIALVPIASASGSGYNLSFSSSGGTFAGAVNLVGLTTSQSGATIVTTLTVSGQIDLSSSSTFYFVYYGGSTASNATTYAEFYGSATGSWFSSAGGGAYGGVTATVTNSGSSMQFALNTTSMPAASGFTVNAEAYQGSASAGSVSLLGSSNPNGLGGSCNGTSCTSTTAASTAVAWWLYAVLGVVVVIIIVVIVVVLVVMRRKRTPPAQPMMGQPMAGQPPMAPGGPGAPPPPAPPAQ